MGHVMADALAVQNGRALLKKCTLFSSLDEKARHDLAGYARPRSFVAGEQICRLGDHGNSMMAVIVGTVRISLPTVRGKEIILADLRAGELFGEIALLDGRPRSANASALTNCNLMVLERRGRRTIPRTQPCSFLKIDGNALCADLTVRRAYGRYCVLQSSGAPRQDAALVPAARSRDDESYRSRRANWRKWQAGRARRSIAAFASGSAGHSRIEGSLDNHSEARSAA